MTHHNYVIQSAFKIVLCETSHTPFYILITFCFPLSYIYQNTAFSCDDRSRSLYFSNSCRISAAEKFEHHIHPYTHIDSHNTHIHSNKHSQHIHTYIIKTGIYRKSKIYLTFQHVLQYYMRSKQSGFTFCLFFLLLFSGVSSLL